MSGSIVVDPREELRLQLGWNEDHDTYDAWLGTGSQQFQLGSMGSSINVFGVGFELTGNMLAAVPEPNSFALAAFAFLGIRSTKA